MKQFKISDEEIVKMYLEGNSLSKIAKVAQDNVGLMSIRKRLHELGISTKIDFKKYAKSYSRRTYELNEQIFHTIDSSDKAYWLGFLYADGYNNEKKHSISIALQEGDIAHLYKFKEFLNSTRPVRTYTTRGYTKAQIDINSMDISSDLTALGCVQTKTKVRHYPDIPNEFNRDFIRGYYDGNGSMSYTITYRKNWQLNFTGNAELLLQIQTVLENEVKINHTSLNTRKDTTSVSIHYSGQQMCGKILSYMYDGAITYLDRKYDKYCKLYLGRVTCKNNKPREFMETPTSSAEDNHEPSFINKEGATTIPYGSTLKRVEVRGSKKLDDDIV